MRYFFPYRRTPGGLLKLEMQDNKPGTVEILPDKHFIGMSPVRRQVEERLGVLRMADVNVQVHDGTRKFRDTIFNVSVGDVVRLKATYQEFENDLMRARVLDFDGSTEYMYSNSPDFDLNGPEELTNTGFETDTSGWTLNSVSNRNNTFAHGGTWSLQDPGAGTPVYNEYVLPSNRMYQVTVEVWVRIQTYTSGTIKIELLDNSNNVLATKSADTGILAAWQKLVINIDTTLVRKIRLHNTGTAVVYWDDVSLTRAYDCTLAGWVKPSTLVGDPGILGREDTGAFRLRIETNQYTVYFSDDAQFQGNSSFTSATADVMVFLAVTFKRTDKWRGYKNGVFGGDRDISGCGKKSGGTELRLGEAQGVKFPGWIGEFQFIKGTAVDANTVLDWYNNGMLSRHDTIAYWRWRAAMNLGGDYSGRNNNLTPVGIDSNDLIEEGNPGSMAPYKQRLQKDETLFYGPVDLRTVRPGEKDNHVEFTAFDPIKLLSEIPVTTLYTWLVQNGYEQTKMIEYRVRVPNGPPAILYSGRAIRVVDILKGMSRLIGLADASVKTLWMFMDNSFNLPSGAIPFDQLYVITLNFPDQLGTRRNIFDSDLSRSPLSFVRFNDCLTLLRHLQHAFFAFSYGEYNAQTDVSNLIFLQRGFNTQFAHPNGALLDMPGEYETTPGVAVNTKFDDDLGDYIQERGSPKDPDAFSLEMGLKTWDNILNTRGPDYSYLYGSFVSNALRGDLQRCWRVICTGWPLNGVFRNYLADAVADAYYSGYGGRKTIHRKRHYRVTGEKEGQSSMQALHPLELHQFVYRDSLKQTEIREAELDVFKNESEIAVMVRTES